MTDFLQQIREIFLKVGLPNIQFQSAKAKQ